VREADEAPGAVWADAVRRGAEERQEAVAVSVEDSAVTVEDEVVGEEDSVRAEGHPEDGARPGAEGVSDRCASFSRIPLLRMYIIFGLTTLDHRLRSAVSWAMSEDHGMRREPAGGFHSPACRVYHVRAVWRRSPSEGITSITYVWTQAAYRLQNEIQSASTPSRPCS